MMVSEFESCNRQKLYRVSTEHLTVLKLSVNFSTSNRGLCPHSGEHEYELVKFQVFSQELFHHFGTFTSSHV